MKSCAEPDCAAQVHSRGFCSKHYSARRYAGEFGAGACAEDGCTRGATSRGYCGSHYTIRRRTGEFGGVKCLHDGCPRVGTTRGYCHGHYVMHGREGDFSAAPCDVPGCEAPSFLKGVCSRHYRVLLEYRIDKQGLATLDTVELCEICGTAPATDTDHCHSSGRVRGRLCNPCNQGLGQFKDSVELLKAAIEYLERGPL